jgi:hypothetical protein
VDFEPVDVEAKPERLVDLKRLGIPRVPATILGDQAVHGWNPGALAALVGVEYAEPGRLPPDELARRLDLVLAAAQRAMRQVTPDGLLMKGPGRDRTLRVLGHHVFRLSAGFADAREQGRLPEGWLTEAPPDDVRDGEDIARYGEAVRARLTALFRRPGWCDGSIETYYGTQSAHAVMERTTWHAAQHLRQIYWFLDRMGVKPDTPLTDDDLAGLPFPNEVWS